MRVLYCAQMEGECTLLHDDLCCMQEVLVKFRSDSVVNHSDQ